MILNDMSQIFPVPLKAPSNRMQMGYPKFCPPWIEDNSPIFKKKQSHYMNYMLLDTSSYILMVFP
jgi:hypothetical protein